MKDQAKFNKDKLIVFDKEIQHRIIEDIKEMDADMFQALIEFMYPVKAKLNDDGMIELEPSEDYKSQGLNLKDIF